MRSLGILTVMVIGLGLASCDDDPVKSRLPDAPPPPSRGVQAFVQVSKTDARPGDDIQVFIRVQMGTDVDAKLGSYTGRLLFDPEVIVFKSETKIDDGMRVTNPNGAGSGEIRFAGASAAGFNDLTIFTGVFEVKKSNYLDVVKLNIEELSAALTLTDLSPQLDVSGHIFLRPSAN